MDKSGGLRIVVAPLLHSGLIHKHCHFEIPAHILEKSHVFLTRRVISGYPCSFYFSQTLPFWQATHETGLTHFRLADSATAQGISS